MFKDGIRRVISTISHYIKKLMPSMKYENDEEMKKMSLRDWRQALRTPPTYRIGNSTLRIQTTFVSVIALLGLVVLLVLYATSRTSMKFNGYGIKNDNFYSNYIIKHPHEKLEKKTYHETEEEYYNATYPLTPPLITASGIQYRIGIISDLDTNSKDKFESNTWRSYLKKGHLMWYPNENSITIVWDRIEPTELKSTFGQNGRGMELSELVVFNGKLLSFDDRTGIVYEINPETNKVIPWVLLVDGNGMTTKGMIFSITLLFYPLLKHSFNPDFNFIIYYIYFLLDIN